MLFYVLLISIEIHVSQISLNNLLSSIQYSKIPFSLQVWTFSIQTEENTLMKEALGKMKNSKEKNMCWQDGRLFEDKEDWIVDSCTKCTCQVVPRQMCRFSINVDDRAGIPS